MNESTIETAILQYLNKQGYFSFKIPDQRAFRNGAYQKNAYMPRGIPDILCNLKGKIIFFEVKHSTGKMSSYQTSMSKKLSCYYVVRSIEDVKAIIKILV